MDVLSDIVDRVRARGSVFAHSVLRAPWAFSFEAEATIQFHTVLGGGCWLLGPGDRPLWVGRGDVVFIVVDEPYVLADDPATPPVDFAPYRDAARRERAFRWDGPGAPTTLLCGAYGYDATLGCDLPDVLHVRGGDGVRSAALRATLAMLADELRHDDAGSQLVIDRLLDALLVQVLRVWTAGDGDGAVAHAWTVPTDPLVAEALQLMSDRPADPWTLGSLARAVGLSRSAFARRFAAEVGEPAMTHLTRRRMALAAELLRSTDHPVGAIAARAGYESVFAFSTAFKRTTGHSPTHFRRTTTPAT